MGSRWPPSKKYYVLLTNKHPTGPEHFVFSPSPSGAACRAALRLKGWTRAEQKRSPRLLERTGHPRSARLRQTSIRLGAMSTYFVDQWERKELP